MPSSAIGDANLAVTSAISTDLDNTLIDSTNTDSMSQNSRRTTDGIDAASSHPADFVAAADVVAVSSGQGQGTGYVVLILKTWMQMK